jgi:hypothetical protein
VANTLRIGRSEYSVVRELRGKGLSAILLLSPSGSLRILVLDKSPDRAWQLFAIDNVRKVKSGRGWADAKSGVILE